MKKLWLFGSYQWQGNPKALFLYMKKNYKESHEVWWVSDTIEEANRINSIGLEAIYIKSKEAKALFKKADVYVTENFREFYPEEINENCILLNLWHGVGLKHVEFAVGMQSVVAKNMMRKYIANYSLLKNNTLFLTTSSYMENHFLKDMRLSTKQIIRGGYPRNIVYRDSSVLTFDFKEAYNLNLDAFSEVMLYAPTWRKGPAGTFRSLISDIRKLNSVLKKKNTLLIIKAHPQTTNEVSYQQLLALKHKFSNILFWNEEYDVYEVFNKITVGIIDYSSIFYDLLEAGVNKFIRYIPDYEEYITDSELIGDYTTYTDGVNAHSYNELLQLLEGEIPKITKQDKLFDTFFEYAKDCSLNDLIDKVDQSIPQTKKFPELHTFDIFDTLIRRKSLEPKSIFYKIQQDMKESKQIEFPKYLVEKYPEIRHQVEIDLRDVYRKTTFERGTDKIEITLAGLLERLQDNYDLSDEQINFLYEAEVREEIAATERIDSRIEEYFCLKAAGSEVMLVSDMYLPEKVIRQMLEKVDSRFVNEKLYLSSEIGYQKSTGKLYEYIFFDMNYQYKAWIHHGDNKHADGVVPRRYGIRTITHDMDAFIGLENQLIKEAPAAYKWDGYNMAAAIQRYRWRLIDSKNMKFDETLYYSFAYIGTALVPYIDWVLEHALQHRYKTLYFISRDGYYLKQIADVIIEKKKLPVQTRYIYGSRKAWRVASFVDEVDPASFTPFGMFSNLDTFKDLVEASQLEEEELLELLPDLEAFREVEDLRGNNAVAIRKIFEKSREYKERLMEIAAKKRELVRDYLQQEIDFNSSFAFVEFWGRGYTQDTLTRLLADAAGREVKNPFYYVRNFTPNHGNSIRHRFMSMPANFSYFEPIFAQTPYKSIHAYQYGKGGKIEPIIVPAENEFNDKISKGLQDFAAVYSELSLATISGFNRYLAETSYTYQFTQPCDSFIANVFAKFKDNLAMYGEPVEYAPVLTEEDIEAVGINNLHKLTNNMAISMARSSEEVRTLVNEELNKHYQEKEQIFITNSLDKYIGIDMFPKKIIALKKQSLFQNIGWSENSRIPNKIKKNQILEVEGIEWTQGGTPRLRIAEGYLTASKTFNRTFDKIKKVYAKIDTPLYKDINFTEIISRAEKGECLEILKYEYNDSTEYILTSKGYLELINGHISISPIKKSQKSDVKQKSMRKIGRRILAFLKRLLKKNNGEISN